MDKTELHLNQVELLINQEKYEEALKQISTVKSFIKLDKTVKLTLLTLKSCCYLNLGDLAEANETSNQLLNQSRLYENTLYELKAVCILLKISFLFETRDESKGLINMGESLLELILDKETDDYKLLKAAFLYLKAMTLNPNIELNKQLPLLQESLSLREEINDKAGICESLFGIGNFYFYKGDHNLALKFFKDSLAIGEEIGNKYLISQSYRALGNIDLVKGRFNHALDYTERALSLAESVRNKCDISHNLHHLAEIYYHKGELPTAEIFITSALELAESIGFNAIIILGFFDLGRILQERGGYQSSLECYEKALNLAREKKAKFYLPEALYNLIRLYTYHLNPIKAEPFLKELEEFREQNASVWHDLMFRISKALMLKTSKRLPAKMEALKIFQELAEEPCIVYKVTVEAIINLCELFLYELKTTGNEDILRYLNHYSNRLLEIAYEQNSHSLLAETHWLQSKLALLKLDIREAQSLMLKAQAITEEKGLIALANSISYDHYSFFSQLQKWEEYIDMNISLNKRIELAQLENLVVKMIYRQFSDVPKKTLEELMKIEEFRTYLKEAKKILNLHKQREK